MRPILFFVASLSLVACATPKGTFRLEAFDLQGQKIQMRQTLLAMDHGIYRVRNGICIAYPKSTVVITDHQTGQELQGESPYRCP